MSGFKNIGRNIKRTLNNVKEKLKPNKHKDDGIHKPPPLPQKSSDNDKVGQKKKPDATVEERTQHDNEVAAAAAQALLKKNMKPTSTPTSPNVTSPAVPSPAGSCERIDNSKGDKDQSESGATAKSIKDAGVSDHFGHFLDQIAGKGWSTVAEEFKAGYRTNAEVNRTTRYVIGFNVPPDGDFYDANRVELELSKTPANDPRFILAAVPDTSITSKETFWRMIYDSTPSLVMFVENYEEEKKDSKEKPFVPWNKGDTKDYGKMTVNNKKTTTDCTMNAMLEVLPEGCSNSIITRFVQVFKWPETVLGDPDGSSRNAALHAVRMIKDEKGPILIVCNNGCGRSAMFIMLHAILTKLNARMKVNMPLILGSLRSDRWGAIQTVEQYLTLHLLILDYIRSKFPRLKDQSSHMKKSLNEYVEKTYNKKK
uniref:Tyrosine phosphatase n=1 Tax=Pristionchus pacificus TaxID=54126 RepID=A0A8R1U439_PRIPA